MELKRFVISTKGVPTTAVYAEAYDPQYGHFKIGPFTVASTWPPSEVQDSGGRCTWFKPHEIEDPLTREERSTSPEPEKAGSQ